MLTTHHEVAPAARPSSVAGDIDAKCLGGLQVDGRPLRSGLMSSPWQEGFRAYRSQGRSGLRATAPPLASAAQRALFPGKPPSAHACRPDSRVFVRTETIPQ